MSAGITLWLGSIGAHGGRGAGIYILLLPAPWGQVPLGATSNLSHLDLTLYCKTAYINNRRACDGWARRRSYAGASM
jgi:hypothetical protein